MSFQDNVNLAKIRRKRYVIESKEKLLVGARGDTENKEMNTESEFKRRRRHERKTNRIEKVMQGQFLRQTEEVADKDQWLWLIKGDLKRETETLIMAAQEQTLRTNLLKTKVDKTQGDSKCRM